MERSGGDFVPRRSPPPTEAGGAPDPCSPRGHFPPRGWDLLKLKTGGWTLDTPGYNSGALDTILPRPQNYIQDMASFEHAQ